MQVNFRQNLLRKLLLDRPGSADACSGTELKTSPSTPALYQASNVQTVREGVEDGIGFEIKKTPPLPFHLRNNLLAQGNDPLGPKTGSYKAKICITKVFF